MQPQTEHEQDDAKLGQGFDDVKISDEGVGRGVGADDKACENVAQHHGLAKFAEQYGDRPRHQHDYR